MSDPLHAVPAPEPDDELIPGPLERRGFIKLAAGALGVCYAGALGYPIYRYLASPVEQAAAVGAVNEVTLPDALNLPKNAALLFRFGTAPAMLIHHPDDTWTALSAVCTHLGCTPQYEPENQRIFCPCHSGVYDPVTGANISGPPPKPLTRYPVEVTDGKLTVRRS